MAETNPQLRQPPNSEDRSDARRLHILTQIFSLIRLAIYFLGWALLLYVGIALPLFYTAGQHTTIDIVYRAILDFQMHVVVPYVVAAATTGLWMKERRLRKRSVNQEHVRTEQMERRIDPSRTSSGFEEIKPTKKTRKGEKK